MTLSIDDAIKALQAAKAASPLGGDTCIAICLDGSEIEYLSPHVIEVESDSDGALLVLRVEDHPFRDRLGSTDETTADPLAAALDLALAFDGTFNRRGEPGHVCPACGERHSTWRLDEETGKCDECDDEYGLKGSP